MMHVSEDVLDENKQIDPHKIDLVARLGANWYSRTNGNSLFEVAKPLLTLGIGVDQIPAGIRNSTVLTGNNLGQLGNIEKLPTTEEVEAFKNSNGFKDQLAKHGSAKNALHQIAKSLLDENKTEDAWKVLLSE
jgi:hypothetical protein